MPSSVRRVKFQNLAVFLTVLTHVVISSAAGAGGTCWLNQGTAMNQRDLQIQEDVMSMSISSTPTVLPDATALAGSMVQTTTVPTSSVPPQLPRPFDLILGNNFTRQSCPSFFNDYIINNSTLQSCIPFSLLLQNSNGFIRATKYASTLIPIIDASCNVAFDSCSSLMSSLAENLVSPDACGNDMALGNPLVVRAYNGLVSYVPMFHASCLKADSHGKSDQGNYSYCYVNAMNSTSSADSEMYYLPLGLELTTGSSVSCSKCTQMNMEFFAMAAANAESPLNKDYLNAANMVNNACGANFVNASSSVTKLTSGPKNTASNTISPMTSHLLLAAGAAAIFLLY